MKDLYTLAFETSCDDTSVAIVKNGREIIDMKTISQTEIHNKYGGVVPEIASRNHIENISHLAKSIFIDSEIKLDDIDFISVTNCPGLIGSLLVGVSFAKALSYALEIPIVAVNHLKGHIAANFITHKDLEPPFIALVVSGGHSNIVNCKSYENYEIIGKSLDDAAGEAYDKVARHLKLGYPGGPVIEKYAKTGNADKYDLPKSFIDEDSNDFSFSGLKSAVLNLVNSMKMKNQEININDLCASFQKSVNEVLSEKLIHYARKNNRKKIVLAGGVSANKNLRKMIEEKCAKENISLFYPDINLCQDNAAMIGSAGYYEYINNNISDMSMNCYSIKNVM